jgi:hypothetical protein
MSTPIPIPISPVSSTLIAAGVSAIVSLAVLFASNYYFQPHKFKQSLKVENLEKSLQAYGTLITILGSMQAKRERISSKLISEEKKEYSHQMENPFDYKRLVEVMEKKNYLFSQELSEKWFKLLKKDVYFHIYSSLTDGRGLLLADFRELQETAEKEYSELKTKYEQLTGIKLLSRS